MSQPLNSTNLLSQIAIKSRLRHAFHLCPQNYAEDTRSVYVHISGNTTLFRKSFVNFGYKWQPLYACIPKVSIPFWIQKVQWNGKFLGLIFNPQQMDIVDG